MSRYAISIIIGPDPCHPGTAWAAQDNEGMYLNSGGSRGQPRDQHRHLVRVRPTPARYPSCRPATGPQVDECERPPIQVVRRCRARPQRHPHRVGQHGMTQDSNISQKGRATTYL